MIHGDLSLRLQIWELAWITAPKGKQPQKEGAERKKQLFQRKFNPGYQMTSCKSIVTIHNRSVADNTGSLPPQ
jgi:hypothetical protein